MFAFLAHAVARPLAHVLADAAELVSLGCLVALIAIVARSVGAA